MRELMLSYVIYVVKVIVCSLLLPTRTKSFSAVYEAILLALISFVYCIRGHPIGSHLPRDTSFPGETDQPITTKRTYQKCKQGSIS